MYLIGEEERNVNDIGTTPKEVWLVLFGAFGFGVRSGSCGSKYFDRSSGFDRFYFHFSGPIVLRGYRVSSETGRVLQKIGEITF